MQNSKAGQQIISQPSVGRHVSVLVSVVLFLALALLSSARVKAQVQCLSACEQQFAECLRNGGNNSAFAPTCLDTYEACVDACLGSAVALLG
jgi:hypothetical protein